jgi:multicomponent Na+:H+ antiporter subunit F
MIEILYLISEVLLAVTATIALWRTARGPSAHDRVLGLELVALVVVGFLILEARQSEIRFYLDAALALGLFSFVGTVLLARVLEEDRTDD